MKRNRNIDMNDPFFQYTDEEMDQMTDDEFFALLEERNRYVRKKHSILKETPRPKFNSIEEYMEYYDAIPLEDVVNNLNKLFDKYGNT